MRMDPASDTSYTKAEFWSYYQEWYSDEEITQYWDSCQVIVDAPPARPPCRMVLVPATPSMPEHLLLVPVQAGETTVQSLLEEVRERAEQPDLHNLAIEGTTSPLDPIDDIFEVTTTTQVLTAQRAAPAERSRSPLPRCRGTGTSGGAKGSRQYTVIAIITIIIMMGVPVSATTFIVTTPSRNTRRPSPPNTDLGLAASTILNPAPNPRTPS